MSNDIIDINKPDAAQNRTELTTTRIVKAWATQERGREFADALLGFFQSLTSRGSLLAYSYSVLEFFDWMSMSTGTIPTPAFIRRTDTAKFVEWLRNREVGLQKERLAYDPTRQMDSILYSIVFESPGINIDGIRAKLLDLYPELGGNGKLRIDVEKPGAFAHHLACLVKLKTLVRRPSVTAMRRKYPRPVGGNWEIPDNVYSYYVPRVTREKGAARSSTVMSKLGGLSSFWSFMMKGENVPGAEAPLIKYNIWVDPLKYAAAQAKSHKAIASDERKMTPTVFLQLLATTFRRSHRMASVEAARAAYYGRDTAPISLQKPSVRDLRNRLIVLFLGQTGVRCSELISIRYSDITNDNPPIVTVTGKRGKKRRFVLPPGTQRALLDFNMWLREQAVLKPGGLAARLLEPDAPVVPAVGHWGASAQGDDKGQHLGLRRPAVYLLLRNMGIRAKLTPEELRQVHPHGFRHFFARQALEAGTPPHIVQAILGHESLGTTGQYAKGTDPQKLMSDQLQPIALTASEDLFGSLDEPQIARTFEEAAKAEEERKAQEFVEKAREAKERPRLVESPVPGVAPMLARVREQIAGEPTPAPPPAPLAGPPTTGEMQIREMLQHIAIWRGTPGNPKHIMTAEIPFVNQCQQLPTETLRKLCLIYRLHWGEKGNRQPLFPSGGRQRKEEEGYEQNPDVEELEGEWIEEEELPPAATRKFLEEELTPEELAIVETGGTSARKTIKVRRIDIGKDSGLPWWTGTNGQLKPEMPVVRATQLGDCSPTSSNVLCLGLLALWRDWMLQDPTRAMALVKWVEEAIDASQQLDEVVAARPEAHWVPITAAWSETRLIGTRRKPLPRISFREHLDSEVLDWFRARAWFYHQSTGDPESFEKSMEHGKVSDAPLPSWFGVEDPVLDVPLGERHDMLDWIRALVGQLPLSRQPLFGLTSEVRASREQIAAWINAICSTDGSIDGLREQLGPEKTAALLKHPDERSKLPVDVRRGAEEAAYRLKVALGGQEVPFDLIGMIAHRALGQRHGKRQRRKDWIVGLMKQYFGPDAAKDAVLRLVAQCGKTPLAAYRELFRVEGGTIVHSHELKQEWARRYGVHSECAARRVARQLWEIHKSRPQSEQVTRPKHTAALANVMMVFHVPCQPAQERELQNLLRAAGKDLSDPARLYQAWSKESQEAPSDVEAEQAALQEEYASALAREFASSMHANAQAVPPMPTPIHLATCFAV